MAKTNTTATPKPVDDPEKKTRRKRVRKPIEIPSLDSFKDETTREQFAEVLKGAKSLTDAFQSAEGVSAKDLREVRRGVVSAMTKTIRSRKMDPVTKKKSRLERTIRRAQKQLEELGITV